VARRPPSAAGRLMVRDVNALSALVQSPGQPLVAIIGGARARDIGLVRRLLQVADLVCNRRRQVFPILAASGHSIGASLCPREDVERARAALASAAGRRLALPKDLLLARWSQDEGPVMRALDGVDVPDGWMGLDIGPKPADLYAAEVGPLQNGSLRVAALRRGNPHMEATAFASARWWGAERRYWR
jgi:phosphoglycerate kinase